MGDWVFVASGDACGVCQALDGSDCMSQPHDSCRCQVEPYHCETDIQFSEVVHTGPGEYDYAFGAEITVTCPDGSTVGMSVGVVMNEQNIDDPNLGGGIDAAADELCEQCGGDGPNVA